MNLLEFSCCYWHLPALALVTQMVGPSDPAPLHLRTAFAADTAASTIPAKRRSRQNLDAQLSRQNLLPRECGVSATEARFWAELVHVEVGHCPLRWGVEYLRGGRTKRCRAICLKKKKKKKLCYNFVSAAEARFRAELVLVQMRYCSLYWVVKHLQGRGESR